MVQLVADGLKKPQPCEELPIEKNVKGLVVKSEGVNELKFNVRELRLVLRPCRALKLAAVSWGVSLV